LSDQERSGINVRVYQVPHDERGQAINNSKLLWMMCEPIDKYTKDELFRVIQRGFFKEGQQLMWVRLMIYKEGENRIRRNLLFPILAAPKAAPNETETNRSQVADILAMVAKMNAEAAQRQDAFFQRLAEARSVAPPVDPMAMMRDTVAILAPLLGMGRAAVAVDPMAQLGGMISTMRQVKQLGDELGGKDAGGGEGGGGVVDVIKALVPLAQPAMEIAASMARRSGPAPAVAAPAPAVAAPAPAVAAPAPAAPAPQPEPPPMDIMKLRDLLGRAADLEGQAEVQTVAEQILKEIPESEDDEVYRRLSAANWFDQLQILQPKVAGKQAFFTQIREYILKQFTPLD